MAFQFSQTGQELQYLADTAEKIAAEYDETASWTTGDYCTHEGAIYRCTGNTTGTFDASKWTAVILCDELEGLRTRMTTAEGNISSKQDALSVGLQNVNIDNLRGNTVGWVQAGNASGTQPSGYQYYLLLTLNSGNGQSAQLAFQLGSGAIAARIFANSSWSSWRLFT